MYYGYIYKTTNLINGKIYIGRKNGNFKPSYFGSGKHLKRAINKYGINNFRVKLIRYAKNKTTLYRLEKEYIKKYRNRFGKNKIYNITDGGKDTHEGGIKYHKIKCKCIVCKNKRGEKHSLNCLCSPCRNRRGEKHKLNCACYCCKMESGNYKGKKHPSYGTHYIQTESAKDKIRKDVSNRKWMYNLKLKQVKRILKKEVGTYLINGWRLGNKCRSLGIKYWSWTKNV